MVYLGAVILVLGFAAAAAVVVAFCRGLYLAPGMRRLETRRAIRKVDVMKAAGAACGCEASTLSNLEQDWAPGFKTVTICGSMRFYDVMLTEAGKLSLAGYIVLFPFVVFKPQEQLNNADKQMLDRMHFAKIDVSDAIYVVNVGGYIGQSTRNEIGHAKRAGKEIMALEMGGDNGI